MERKGVLTKILMFPIEISKFKSSLCHLSLLKPGLPLDSRSVCPFFLKESLFCCFCLKSVLVFPFPFLLLFS